MVSCLQQLIIFSHDNISGKHFNVRDGRTNYGEIGGVVHGAEIVKTYAILSFFAVHVMSRNQFRLAVRARVSQTLDKTCS